MEESNRVEHQPTVTIAAGAWIGLAGLALTMVLALFGAAGWIVTRIDRLETRLDTRIDRLDAKMDVLDTRVDALSVDVATMRGQLGVLTQTGQPDQDTPSGETAPGE